MTWVWRKWRKDNMEGMAGIAGIARSVNDESIMLERRLEAGTACVLPGCDPRVCPGQFTYTSTRMKTYPPLPTMAVSPTRPSFFAVMPPVDVAAAHRPSSHTTHPTVSCPLWCGGDGDGDNTGTCFPAYKWDD